MRAGRGFAPWLALAAVLVAAGCGSSLPGVNLPPVREVQPAREFPSLRDYRGILDCRPRASGVTQVKLAELAAAAQVDFVGLADRAKPGSGDYGVGGFTNQLLVVPGASFAAGGEIVGLNIHSPIDPAAPPAAIVEAIHRQGGIAIAVAPSRFASSNDYALADALEVYNLEREWRSQSALQMYLRGLFLTAGRLFADLDIRPNRDLLSYDQMAAGARVTLVAGVGGEENLSVLGAKVGTFPQLFQVCTTHLLATERDIDPLMDALKRGHSYVSFDIMGYVPDFAFYAQDGGTKVMMGDEAQFVPGTRLELELPAAADEIVMLRDGTRVGTVRHAVGFDFQPTARGAYRVEVYRRGRLWILSNPVYLR